jgi:large subunit ribosomal protein L16
LQYGIVAIHGGYMEPRHFEMLRQKFSKYLVEGKSFAIYRVDAPFKPWTRKGTGKALGGGKGSIDHYRSLFITSLWLFCQFTSISN